MQNKIKVVIFGCQQIAVDFIEHLSSLEDIEISLIATYELPLDATYGYESVVKRAKEKGLLVTTRGPRSMINKIKEIEPDIIFSVYYRKILCKEILSIPRIGCINIHPSKLPYYRGPVPTAWAIKKGEKRFGITIHDMDEGIDTGDILVQEEYDIFDEETGHELYTRGMKLGAELLRKNFYKLVNQALPRIKQEGTGSYFGKLKGKHVIDWQQGAEEIKNIIRIHAKPYNSAETLLFNRYVLINKVSIIRNDKYILQGVGKIIDILDGDKLVVTCADGCLMLEDYEILPYLSEDEKKIYIKIGNEFG